MNMCPYRLWMYEYKHSACKWTNTCWTAPGRPVLLMMVRWIRMMTLPCKRRIWNLDLDDLQSITRPLHHRVSPQYWFFTSRWRRDNGLLLEPEYRDWDTFRRDRQQYTKHYTSASDLKINHYGHVIFGFPELYRNTILCGWTFSFTNNVNQRFRNH